MKFSLAIVALIAGYTWLIDPVTPRWVGSMVTLLVLILSGWRAVLTGEWGLRRSAFFPALLRVVAFTVPAVLTLCLVGAALGGGRPRENPWRDLAFLVAWGGSQQFALQTVLLREAQAATSRGKGIAIAAAVFGALHLPNPFLTAVTLVGALAWCFIYDRHSNLLPLALSHALCTLAILSCFDPRLTGRLRIGYSYLQLD